MSDIEPRVTKLEWRVDNHSNQLTRLHNTTSELKEELCNINKSLLQIKYLALGGAVILLGDSIGLTGLFQVMAV